MEGSATDTDDDIKSYTWGIEDDDEDCSVAGDLAMEKIPLHQLLRLRDVPKDCSIAYELAVEDMRGNIGNDLVLVTVKNVETFNLTPSISVSTDKQVYQSRREVNIFGGVTGIEDSKEDDSLQIIDPNKKEFGHYDTDLKDDGSFVYETESMEGASGEYKVTASYVFQAQNFRRSRRKPNLD